MDFITVKEASEIWNTDVSTIGKMLRAKKIIGATKLGGHWVIPKNAPKPVDGRRRKTEQKTFVFRFPLYVNSPKESYAFPLSDEEAELRKAQEYFYACDFQKAKPIFEALSENCENIYVKICAHFFMCVLSAVYDTAINRNQYYCRMNFLISKDFPHNREMEIFLPLLDFYFGLLMDIPKKLKFDSSHEYHSSAIYMSAFLSIFCLQTKKYDAVDLPILEPYKTLCIIMERDGYYLEAQLLHIMLFVAYYATPNKEEMQHHLKKAIDIAYEHNLIYAIADMESYYSAEVGALLSEYPSSFSKQIQKSSKIIYENFVCFNKINDTTTIYSRLSKSDYPFIIYAIKGFTNNQVANICGISERTVSKKYNEIYDKLGINGKKELIFAMSDAFSSEIQP